LGGVEGASEELCGAVALGGMVGRVVEPVGQKRARPVGENLYSRAGGVGLVGFVAKIVVSL
jgi:hypothetical protein